MTTKNTKKKKKGQKKWGQKVARNIEKKGHEGLLHRKLGIPQDKKIGRAILIKIKNAKIGSTVSVNGKRVKVDARLKQEAIYPLNVSKK